MQEKYKTYKFTKLTIFEIDMIILVSFILLN